MEARGAAARPRPVRSLSSEGGIAVSQPKLLLAVVLLAFACAAQSDLGPWVSCPAPGEAKTIVVGDLNGDGRDDAAVAAWPSGLHVFYQQPDGTLAPPLTLFTPNMPLGLAMGDLNGDGRHDLVVGGTDELLLIYYQQPDGVLGAPSAVPSCGSVSSIAVADLNGDGLDDLAQVGQYCPAVLVSLQGSGGDLGFPSLHSFAGSNARCVCVPDLNQDGARDLAFLVDGRICFMLANGGGGFDAPQYLPATWAHSLVAGDVTGDGADDLVFTVATNAPDAAIGVYPMADGGPGPLRQYPAYDFAQPLALVDLNGDGLRDVAAAHGGYEALTVTPQIDDGGLGSWAACPLPYCNGYQPGGLACGDLNSDGLVDLAVADWRNGLVVLTQTGGVVDDVPPVLVMTALVTTIWPPNGAVVAVPVSVTAADEGSGIESLTLTVTDEYGLVQPEIDVTSDLVSVPLVASRYEDDPDGRAYTLVLTGADKAGNVASVTAVVTVPKSSPKKPPKPVKPKK